MQKGRPGGGRPAGAWTWWCRRRSARWTSTSRCRSSRTWCRPGVKALARHAQRLAGDRPRHRQGQRGRHPGDRRGHPGRPAAAKEAGIKVATFVGSDNYEGGQDRRPAPGGGHRRQGERRACWRASPATRRATRGCAVQGRHQGLDRASRSSPPRPRTGSATRASTSSRTCCRRTPRSTPVFACNDMMALGAVEAIAAAGQDGQDPGVRLRRRGRRAQGDRRGHDGRLGRAVPRGDGPRGRRERGQAPEGRDGAAGSARAHRAGDEGPSRRSQPGPAHAAGCAAARRPDRARPLGRVYARDLATRIPETRLVAVADPDAGPARPRSAGDYERAPLVRRTRRPSSTTPRWTRSCIVSPTHTHAGLVHRRGRRGQGHLLREAAGPVAGRDAGDEGGGRPRRASSSRWASCAASTPATRRPGASCRRA